MLHLIGQHLQTFLIDVVRLCLWLLILSVIFVPLERLFALRPQKIFRKAIVIDLGYYFLNSLLTGLLLSAPLALVAWGAHRVVPWSVQTTVAAWPLWLRILATLLVAEVGFYWGHRWSHEVPVLWQFHKIHHSAEQLDFIVNTRAHPVDMVFNRLCGLVPLYVLGLASPVGAAGSLMPVLILLITTMWGFFIHANLRWRLGPLEWVISAPRFPSLAPHPSRADRPKLCALDGMGRPALRDVLRPQGPMAFGLRHQGQDGRIVGWTAFAARASKAATDCCVVRGRGPDQKSRTGTNPWNSDRLARARVQLRKTARWRR